jgi:hypothetical protein
VRHDLSKAEGYFDVPHPLHPNTKAMGQILKELLPAFAAMEASYHLSE